MMTLWEDIINVKDESIKFIYSVEIHLVIENFE